MVVTTTETKQTGAWHKHLYNGRDKLVPPSKFEFRISKFDIPRTKGAATQRRSARRKCRRP